MGQTTGAVVERQYLACDSCFGAAVVADADGFFDLDAGECAECGRRGHIEVESSGRVWWSSGKNIFRQSARKRLTTSGT